MSDITPAPTDAQSAEPHPYDVLGMLATGGMAEVYLGRRVSDGALIVLKRLRPCFADDAEYQTMFSDERRLMRQLSGHPHIVELLDAGVLDGSDYMALELLEGLNFHQMITAAARAGERLPVAVVLRVAIDALQGLSHAHRLRDAAGRSMGIVHRDISPHNVIVTWSGMTKVLDFGVALSSHRVHQTRPGLVKGKPGYMSPEQLRVQRLDARSDLFAVGTVLYEALSGRHPFEDGGDILQAIMRANPPPLLRVASDVPPDVAAVVHRALYPTPEGRFRDADEMALALGATSVAPATHAEVAAHLNRISPDSRLPARRLSKTPPPAEMSWQEPEELGPELQSVLELMSQLYEPEAQVRPAPQELAPPPRPEPEPEPEPIERSPSSTPLVEGQPGAPDSSTLAVLLIVASMVLLAASLGLRLVSLPGPQGKLQVRSNPSGAEVLVDGAVQGRTPFVMERPAEGSMIDVRRDGFAPCKLRVGSAVTSVDCVLRRTK